MSSTDNKINTNIKNHYSEKKSKTSDDKISQNSEHSKKVYPGS